MNLVLRRHANADRIICVNDSYDQDYSIKDSESILRRKQLPIRNVFMKAEDKFPSSRDFQALLGKPENKIRLQAFLQNEFKRTAATTDTEIIYCVQLAAMRRISLRERVCQNSYASKQRQIRPCSPYIVSFGQMATQQQS